MTPVVPTVNSPDTGRRSLRTLVAHQVHYDMRTFARNTQSVFFTLALPVMFLLIFASVFGHGSVTVPGGSLNESVYYVPGIIALGIISASFGNLATSVIGNREAGIYKRRRATPVSAAALIAARAVVAVAVAVVITLVLVAIGYAYGASLAARAVPALVLDVVIAGLAFCCLGFALASVVHSRDAATPVIMFITLPLYFISGVFIASAALPHWLLHVAAVFPVRHLATALLAVYDPRVGGSGFRWGDLAVIAGWGVFGLIVAVRRFSWFPHR